MLSEHWQMKADLATPDERTPVGIGDETGMRAARIYQLKVTLRDSKPPIWRRLQVSGDITLAELHDVILTAMGGWDGWHYHCFEIGAAHYGGSALGEGVDDYIRPSGPATLHRLVRSEGITFKYEYDFGDGWRHTIKVERILPPQEGVKYPLCLAGRRAGPADDCGGIWGYYELLDILSDSSHQRHAEIREWMGDWDPEWFSVDAVNARLHGVAGPDRAGGDRPYDRDP
jgi:hypothetical protein